MKAKVTYIIPLHKKDDRVFRAIGSVPSDAALIVSCPEDVQLWLAKAGEIDEEIFEVCGHDAPTASYPDLVNSGIMAAKENGAEWISILEFDDELVEPASSSLYEYIEAYDDAEVLCPLACIVKETEGEPDKPTLMGMANEASFAAGVVEEFGYFDLNSLLKTNFIFLKNY